jgi:hypothetical protein
MVTGGCPSLEKVVTNDVTATVGGVDVGGANVGVLLVVVLDDSVVDEDEVVGGGGAVVKLDVVMGLGLDVTTVVGPVLAGEDIVEDGGAA